MPKGQPNRSVEFELPSNLPVELQNNGVAFKIRSPEGRAKTLTVTRGGLEWKSGKKTVNISWPKMEEMFSENQ